MAYGEQEFIKELNGVAAPKGFHYMPNGKLMNDAHHVAQFGYIEKTINSIDINLNDINSAGEKRNFTINGDNGAYFSMKVYDSDNKYYNFYDNTWSTNNTGLNKLKIKGNRYVNKIDFPSTTTLKSYTIDLIAEIAGNCRSSHVGFVEVRNPDNSININNSFGSDSSILTKIIYQDAAKTLTLSCIAPSLYATSTLTVNGAVSSGNKIIVDEVLTNKNIAINDLVTVGAEMTAAEHSLVTQINPDKDNSKEFQISVNNSVSDGVELTLTPSFNGVTPHSSDSTTGASVINTYSGASFTSPFEVDVIAPTGRGFFVNRIPTTEDLCAFVTRTIGSAGIPLPEENTSSDSVFFRFGINNIAGLANGMSIDPSRSAGGANTTTPALITSYTTTATFNTVLEGPYSDNIVSNKSITNSVDGVDPVGNNITASDRNGVPTAQAGNVIFNQQQAAALTGDTSKIYAHGSNQIKTITNGMVVSIRNVEVEEVKVKTVTSGAVSSSSTIGLSQVSNVIAGAEVFGTQITNSAARIPLTVVSKSASSGAGNITVSTTQTLDSGQTVNFNVTSNFKIKGIIEVENMPIANTTLFFDLERFVTCR